MHSILQTDLKNVSSMKISPNGKMVGILSNTDMYIYNLHSGILKICFSQNEEYLNQSQKNTITTHQLKS